MVYTGVDYFCGFGGWLKAVELLREQGYPLQIICGINHDPLALEVYKRSGVVVKLTDIREEALAEMVPDADYGLFSPTCKGYSNGGGESYQSRHTDTLFPELYPKKPNHDKHLQERLLIHQVSRFTRAKRYPIVFVENVIGMGKDPEFKKLYHEMCAAPSEKGLGYQMRQMCLDAAVFGAACHRNRTYLVFAHPDIDLPKTIPAPRVVCEYCEKEVFPYQLWGKKHTTSPLRWGEYQQQYWYHCPDCHRRVFPPMRAAREILDLSLPMETVEKSNIRSPNTYASIAAGIARYQGAPFLRTYNGNPVYSTLDEPLRTVVTNDRLALTIPQGPRVEDALHRLLTIPELLAAMTFDPEMELAGNKDQQMTMVGNAVCPLQVAQIIAHYFPFADRQRPFPQTPAIVSHLH